MIVGANSTREPMWLLARRRQKVHDWDPLQSERIGNEPPVATLPGGFGAYDCDGAHVLCIIDQAREGIVKWEFVHVIGIGAETRIFEGWVS